MDKKVKRIAAIIGLVLFASLILLTLISAFFVSEKTPGLFLASLFSAIVIPIMIWGFLLVYRLVRRNDSTPDTDSEDPDPAEDTGLSDETEEDSSSEDNRVGGGD
jgi:amino acid permease